MTGISAPSSVTIPAGAFSDHLHLQRQQQLNHREWNVQYHRFCHELRRDRTDRDRSANPDSGYHDGGPGAITTAAPADQWPWRPMAAATYFDSPATGAGITNTSGMTLYYGVESVGGTFVPGGGGSVSGLSGCTEAANDSHGGSARGHDRTITGSPARGVQVWTSWSRRSPTAPAPPAMVSTTRTEPLDASPTAPTRRCRHPPGCWTLESPVRVLSWELTRSELLSLASYVPANCDCGNPECHGHGHHRGQLPDGLPREVHRDRRPPISTGQPAIQLPTWLSFSLAAAAV